ncbi:hypothetical protein BpHYR1_024887 [Brachionus plicatilis]|uniref:Uncharacterized protein n=1 Tax=Brachionus plicatilis TaxID=10195 RepID=A0A3M7PG83_BRAPC|nr:hypothetical protein BpHYR1_024887 [Brachionus plicatilis]
MSSFGSKEFGISRSNEVLSMTQIKSSMTLETKTKAKKKQKDFGILYIFCRSIRGFPTAKSHYNILTNPNPLKLRI